MQLLPFAYLFLYAAYMLASPFVSDSLLCAADQLMTVTPPVAVIMLVASRLFRLCIWHKTACLIPFASQIEDIIDIYVVTFTVDEVVAINLAIGVCVILFMIIAYKHFFYGK